MSFLASLFGSAKVVDTVADTVKTGVGMFDNAFYTEQEKATNNLKFTDLWIKIQAAIANENSVRSITRRILAWIIMGTYTALVVFACGVWKFDPKWAAYIKETLVETNLSYLALIVGFFYFGYYAVSQFMGKKKE